MSHPIKVGAKAPEFTLPSSDGKQVSMRDFRGRKVVLFFYPKDMTPGCTAEACSFRDNFQEIRRKGAEIVGISVDGVQSHKKFADAHSLPFMLLSDEKKDVVRQYKVWKKKSMYGRTYMGTERTTFIVDEDGRISHIFPKVRVHGHTDEILQTL